VDGGDHLPHLASTIDAALEKLGFARETKHTILISPWRAPVRVLSANYNRCWLIRRHGSVQ